MMAKLCDVEQCSKVVRNWFLWNGLALHPDKTALLLLGSAAKLHHINCTNAINVSLVNSMKSLGVKIDSCLTFDKHVNNICQASYFHIRVIRHIRGSMSTDIAKSVASTIVDARLDYCSLLLYGLSAANLHKPQRVQNTLAFIITGTKKCDHVILVLQALHWIPELELCIRSLFLHTKLNRQDN